MKKAIVRIKLAWEFPNQMHDDDIVEIIENFELPNGYVEDSFELIKIEEE